MLGTRLSRRFRRGPDRAVTENAPATIGAALGKLKSAIDVQVAATKRDLAQWLDQKPGPRDSTVIRIALLETRLTAISPNARPPRPGLPRPRPPPTT
jgi:hypothetical protein